MGKLNRRNFCLCGCGSVIKHSNRYVRGHSARVIHWNKSDKANEIKEILSKCASERIGEKSPRFGKTKLTNPNFSNAGAPKGLIPYNKGKGEYLSPEARARVIAGSRGKIPWNKGKTGYFTEEALASITASSKNRRHTEEEIQRIKINTTIALQDPEKRKRMSEANKGISKSPEFCKQLSERVTGSGNPWYIDGRCSGENYEYSLDFNERLKELIRDRDGRICQLCYKTEEQNGKQLDIHHVSYDKENCDPRNLLSLCHSCHMKTNVNRDKWIKIFKSHLTVVENVVNY